MDNVFSRILARAVECQGSPAAIGELLRVPPSTLERWMHGRSHMPLRAFLAVLDLLARDEAARPAPVHDPAGPEPLHFRIGSVFARCERCDSEVFQAVSSRAPLPLCAEVACRQCGELVVHRALLERLARHAIGRRTAVSEAREREPYRSSAIERASDVGLS